ncbi:helix-turn-helix domain-containing protein [Marinomonas sp. A79]|uniref:Helix-turn-helix domain-containing protein n=1 Tax=Marinomonas vulgaris TaxID=2823372 RepID=A0ABS5HAC8_9GAMM|nr:S24 family peptidase [Marinomonas vulgaris]MBR7887919.1 helix-turn-helix domain-containing protein [Marinomonas vulgaris]
MKIAERIKQQRHKLGLTQVELASRVGISQQSLQKIEDGQTRNPRRILELAIALDCSPEWLMHGKGKEVREQPFGYDGDVASDHIHNAGKRPILTYQQAALWPDKYHTPTNVTWVSTYFDASQDAFWLLVKNNSMTSQSGSSIPEGYLVLVEPSQTAQNGDVVVVKLAEHQDVIIKKMVVEGDNCYLCSFNTDYTQIKANDSMTIIGVVIFSMQKFRD